MGDHGGNLGKETDSLKWVDGCMDGATPTKETQKREDCSFGDGLDTGLRMRSEDQLLRITLKDSFSQCQHKLQLWLQKGERRLSGDK